MSFFLPTTGGSTQWGPDMWMARGPGARLSFQLSQEYITRTMKGPIMRVVFNLEIKAEIDSFDTKQRQVFVRMMTEAAKELHTKAVLLSNKVSPDVKVTVEGGGKPTEEISLFMGEGK